MLLMPWAHLLINQPNNQKFSVLVTDIQIWFIYELVIF